MKKEIKNKNLPNDPKFTIPGYIAKMIDEQKTTKLKFNDYDKEFYPYFKWSKEYDKQYGDFASIYLMQAYLNPFTRYLVKIQDGEIQ